MAKTNRYKIINIKNYLKICFPAGECFLNKEDLWILKEFPYWSIHKEKSGTTYVRVRRHILTEYGHAREAYFIHSLILRKSPKKGLVRDHINRDGKDNRRENLRWVNLSQNSRNCSKFKRNATSKFKGVCISKSNKANPWIAQLKHPTLNHGHIGYFKTEKEAARAYNKKSLELFGEYGWQNEV